MSGANGRCGAAGSSLQRDAGSRGGCTWKWRTVCRVTRCWTRRSSAAAGTPARGALVCGGHKAWCGEQAPGEEGRGPSGADGGRRGAGVNRSCGQAGQSDWGEGCARRMVEARIRAGATQRYERLGHTARDARMLMLCAASGCRGCLRNLWRVGTTRL